MYYCISKKIIVILLFAFVFSFNSLLAEDITTVKAVNSEIAESLDLKLVASLFGESKNLEDFENKLNDYDIQASNLDLNNDNEVDYLRVIDILEDGVHVIVIQAVIGVDKYQDVAEIDVQKNSRGLTEVQIVGNSELYGDTYIVEPVYVISPDIFLWFWGIHYRAWHSPYYWGHYPRRHRHWNRCSRHKYKKRARKYTNLKTSYRYVKSRNNKTAKKMRRKNRKFNHSVRATESRSKYKEVPRKRKVRTNWKSNRTKSSNTRVYVHSSKKQNKSNNYKRSRKENKSSWGTSSNRNTSRYSNSSSNKRTRNSYKKENKRVYKTNKKSRKASKAKKSRTYKKAKTKKSKSKKSESKKSKKKRRR